MAIGAYGTALSIKLLHMPFFPACLMGILAAMLAGGLIGRATLRLKGDYFVIATLAIGECTKLLIENIPSITGGSRGLTDIPKKTSLLLVWVILLAVIVILSNFLHSKHGRNCIAVREEELAAKSIGIDVIRYKMLAFLISCALCGLAGGLLAGYMGYLYPTMFTMAKSNELTMTVILGGTGSLTGTILAGLVLIPLPEYLRIESAEEWRMVLYGVLVVAVIVFKPSGLMGSKEFTVAGVLRRCKQLAARVRKRGSKRIKRVRRKMRRAASLKIDHVTKRFGGVIALNDVSFDVTQGEIHGLIGPNGAGKTTLFNLITGIYSPTEGKIELNGRSLVGMSPHQTANLGIARTFQNIRLFDELSVYQNLITACQKHLSYHLADGLFKTPKYRREEKEIAKLTETTLQQIGLWELRDQLAGNLPYGQQRRLEIARALVTDPQLLLLDEPAAGMNEDESIKLSDFIRSIQNMYDTTILIIDHHMDVIMGICDHITVFNFGSKLAEERRQRFKAMKE